MNKKPKSGLKIITINRKASFNYFFKELFEAGIVLKGSEIKSIRSGKVKRAKLYYLRERTGKSARIVEKIKKKIGINIDAKPEQVLEEKKVEPTVEEKKIKDPKTELQKEEPKKKK